MNSTTDLRDALHAAATFEDSGVIGRTRAVHARVARIRSHRRAGAVGVAAAIAVAAVVAAVALPSHPGAIAPANDVVGVPVTTTITIPPTREDDGAARNAAGITYRKTSVQIAPAGTTTFTTTVPAGANDRAVVMVASGLGDGSATLVSDDGTGQDRILGSQVAGAGTGAAVEIGSDKQSFTIKARGATAGVRLALVTYQLDAAATDASGLNIFAQAADGAIYRANVGGRVLVAAGFAAPGKAEFTEHPIALPQTEQFVPYCVVPKSAGDVWLNVSLGGSHTSGVSCGSTPYVDAGGAGSSFSVPSTWKGSQNPTIRVWTSRDGYGGAPAVIDGAVFGLGVYDRGPTREVAGMSLGQVVESAGRVWQLDDVVEHSGQRVVHMTLVASVHARLLWFAAAGKAGTTVEVRGSDGTKEETPQSSNGPGGSAWSGPVLLPGTSYDITMTSTAPIDQGIVVYTPDPDWIYADPPPAP